MHDNDVDRVLDVYVTDNNGTLEISGYVLHKNESNIAISSTMGSNDVMSEGEPLDDKTDGFTNEYKSKDLVFKKEVVGNQASRDKYFEFTLKLENVGNENTFTVSIADDNDPNTTDGKADATRRQQQCHHYGEPWEGKRAYTYLRCFRRNYAEILFTAWTEHCGAWAPSECRVYRNRKR